MRGSVKITACLVVICLLSTAVLAAGAGASGRTTVRSRPSDSLIANADAQFDANPHASAALDRAEARGLFGRFTMSSDTVTGRFVHFAFDNGTFTDYATRSASGFTTLFPMIMVDGFVKNKTAPGGGAKVTGALFREYGIDGIVRAYNSPTAAFAVESDIPRNVTFMLPGNANVTKIDASGNRAWIHFPGFARANAYGTLAVRNGTLTNATGEIVAHLQAGSGVRFVFHHLGANDAILDALESAFASGRFGIATAIVDADGTPVAQGDGDLLVAPKDLGNHSSNVTVSAPDGTGDRLVTLTFDRDSLSGLHNGSIQVLVSGTRANLGDLGTVANATNAAANVTMNATAVFVTVNIPHFSDQTVTVQSTGAGSTGGSPSGGTNGTGSPKTPGFESVAAIAAVSIGALLVAARRRT
jgi:hypothetical protein